MLSKDPNNRPDIEVLYKYFFENLNPLDVHNLHEEH